MGQAREFIVMFVIVVSGGVEPVINILGIRILWWLVVTNKQYPSKFTLRIFRWI